jgi:hypothetical protein
VLQTFASVSAHPSRGGVDGGRGCTDLFTVVVQWRKVVCTPASSVTRGFTLCGGEWCHLLTPSVGLV